MPVTSRRTGANFMALAACAAQNQLGETMDSTSLIALAVSLVLSLLCCGLGVFLFVVVLGFWLLRRRGKKKITVKEAMKTGAVSVSQVFVRGQGGLKNLDEDDDD